MSGLFITLEGGEGAGKTTIANAVIEKLSTLGIETLYTREPGGIKIAEKIREVILDLIILRWIVVQRLYFTLLPVVNI